MRKWLNRVWSVVIRWEHSPATHQQLLVVLLERILPHLDKPLLLTDYLMDSLDMGKGTDVFTLLPAVLTSSQAPVYFNCVSHYMYMSG